MISNVRTITTATPSLEVWKYLRFFLSLDKTVERIRQVHGIKEGEQDQNLRKQAVQIGYCIRQAEQYFRASTTVDLTTRPLLLYYGATSLSQALVLLKQDGTYSLDLSRKLKKHRHHGLDLCGQVSDAGHAKSFREFWECIRCAVHKRESGELWGHFPVFYKCLDPDVFSYEIDLVTTGEVSQLTRQVVQPSADPISIEAVAAKPIQTYDIIKSLPDMCATLLELGETSNLRRGSIKRRIVRVYQTITEADVGGGAPVTKKQLLQITDVSDFFIDGINEADQAALVSFYQERNPLIRKPSTYPGNLYLNLTIQGANDPNYSLGGYYPDIVEDVFGNKLYILNPAGYIPEIAGYLVLLFALGMVARYYPDVWVRNIDQNVEMAEITNAFLNFAHRKFPNLILDQMTGTKHILHT